MYALCDCNNFFASCERVFNPSLNGRAVVVLSNNDGCIIARSNEAKALGIRMGQPLFQIKELVEKNQVAVYSSNYQLYGDMSQRVMEVLRSLSPATEVYSIDEAFMNFEGLAVDSLNEYGKHIARRVKRYTGIPVSLGIAPTKTLAKVASKLCKKYPKLEGCCLMYKPEDIEKVLRTYPIEDIWGIGRRYAKMLKSNRITTAEQFRQMSPQWVQSKMSIVGLRTWKELHGQACIEFEHSIPDKQSLTISRTFAKELRELALLEESISTFVAMAAEKLRKQNSVAGQMQVYIYTNYHREGVPQHHEGELIQFPTPTDSTIEMVKGASFCLRKLFKKGYGYKKAGVILYDISPSKGIQTSLFDTLDRPKHRALMQTLDHINAQHGRATLRLGSEGDVPQNRNHTSPRYTSCWDDILQVRV